MMCVLGKIGSASLNGMQQYKNAPLGGCELWNCTSVEKLYNILAESTDIVLFGGHCCLVLELMICSTSYRHTSVVFNPLESTSSICNSLLCQDTWHSHWHIYLFLICVDQPDGKWEEKVVRRRRKSYLHSCATLSVHDSPLIRDDWLHEYSVQDSDEQTSCV